MLLSLALDANLDGPGLPARDDPPAPIINGDEADEDVYPMTGGMIVDLTLTYQGSAYDMRMFMCSSTLIAPDVVALAAHCLDETTLTYGYGEAEFNDVRWTRQPDLTEWSGYERTNAWPDDAVAAWDWVVHPDFDIWSLSYEVGENADVALLFLDTPVLDVPYARLAVAEEEQALLVEGAEVDVVGWGQQTATSGYEAPPDGTYALKMWGTSVLGDVGEFEMQVGPDEDDVRKCHGDSGGPTFLTVDDGFRLVGITSHAYDQTDCDRKGGVDTRVDAYLDWIDAELRARCEDGTRVWCDEPGIPTGVTPEPDEADPVADAGDEEEKAGGCACTTGAGGGGLGAIGALAAMGLLATRRRR
jgi:MYXO-CTERM domain-containing protein